MALIRGTGAIAELAHRGQGGIEIDQVVVAEFLALQLLRRPPAGIALAVPESRLVGVLPVAKGRGPVPRRTEKSREGLTYTP